MKKIAFAFGLLVLLSGCGADNGEEKTESKGKEFQTFEAQEISIEYPAGWEVLLPKDFPSQLAPETIVGFRNPIKNELFTANFSLVKNNLPSETNSMDYAQGLLQREASNLLNFKEFGRTEVEVKVGSENRKTLLTYFEGKERADSEMKEFFHLSIVKGKTAYIATAGFLKNEDENVKKALESALKTLAVK